MILSKQTISKLRESINEVSKYHSSYTNYKEVNPTCLTKQLLNK